MTFHIPPVLTKMELEIALRPESHETVDELAVRAEEAGYTIVSKLEDRIVVLKVVEEA